MFWYVLLGIAVASLLVTLVLPVPRRIWAFSLTAAKYAGLWFFDLIRIRRLVFAVRGRPYRRLTRPVLFRLFCEDMGPTFIKFGQIVASSAGLFPDAYVKEFQKVLDRVRPFSFADVQRILVEDLGAEKAAALRDIAHKPLASASIAQVHTATLADGSSVVIKVQRPGIAARTAADMKILRFFAGVLARLRRDAELANPVGIVEDFAATLREELDFRKEAANLDRFNEIMRELGHTTIRAPRPLADMTTARVLVMERFFGIRVDQFEEIKQRGLDGEGKLLDGLRAWFQCVVFYGFFHGDVHAGNLMLLDDDTVGFLDFGIVGRFSEEQRWLVIDYMIAFSTGNYRELARVICRMTEPPPGLDLEAFERDLKDTYSPLLTLSFKDVNYAELLPGIQRTATRHQVQMPKEFILITKQLLYFDRYAKALAPDLNVFTDQRLIFSMMSDIQKARAEYERRRQAG
jgi:aarF domain-containing kinase